MVLQTSPVIKTAEKYMHQHNPKKTMQNLSIFVLFKTDPCQKEQKWTKLSNFSRNY